MNRRRLLTWLGGLAVLAVGGVIVNVALGNAPALGLDNHGGVKVVIAPAGDEPLGPDDLAFTRDAVRRSLTHHRVTDASARIEGQRVVVDIPNVANQAEVVADVAAPRRVQLRAFVGGCFAPDPVETTVVDGETTATATADVASSVPGSGAAPSGLRRPAAASTSVPPDTTSGPDSTAGPDSTGVADGAAAPTTTEALLGPLGPGPEVETTVAANEFAPPPAAEDDRNVSRPDALGQQCLLGPAFRLSSGFEGGPFDGQAAGQIFEPGSATANSLVDSAGNVFWSVEARLSAPGIAAYAASMNAGSGTALAVLLDDVVLGSTQASSGFVPQLLNIQVYDEASARRVADGINRGAFGTPTEVAALTGLDATIGAGAWATTVIAGALAVAVVAALMLLGYRRLGVVWAAAAGVWALLCWVGAAVLGQLSGYAIGLGSALILVIFFGVLTAGSVACFERLREDVRHGRRLRNSAQRSFSAAWTRLLAFDVAVFAAGALLMALGAESLRSFGAYLGLAALAHALVTYGVVRPAVLLGTASGWLEAASLFPSASRSAKAVTR